VTSPRWIVEVPAASWSREQDVALFAHGWDRVRPGSGEVIGCAIPAVSGEAARAEAVRVLRLRPGDVSAVAPQARAA
jgi:hypothetical protein